MELFDEIQFDSFNFTGVLNEAALPFVVHNIFQKQDLYSKFHISVSTLYNFTKEIAQGYFKENPYHNVTHIIDSL